jgi:hypothetical protein
MNREQQAMQLYELSWVTAKLQKKIYLGLELDNIFFFFLLLFSIPSKNFKQRNGPALQQTGKLE